MSELRKHRFFRCAVSMTSCLPLLHAAPLWAQASYGVVTTTAPDDDGIRASDGETPLTVDFISVRWKWITSARFASPAAAS